MGVSGPFAPTLGGLSSPHLLSTGWGHVWLGWLLCGRFLCAFSHIFAGGYAAGYYSYKWAEVLSADAFSAFEEVGLENEEEVAQTGRRFRDTVLALGGGREPAKVFEDFRGRPPSVEPLLRHNNLLPALA